MLCAICKDPEYYFGLMGPNCPNPDCSEKGDKRQINNALHLPNFLPPGFIQDDNLKDLIGSKYQFVGTIKDNELNNCPRYLLADINGSIIRCHYAYLLIINKKLLEGIEFDYIGIGTFLGAHIKI